MTTNLFDLPFATDFTITPDQLARRAELNAAQADRAAWVCLRCANKGYYRLSPTSTAYYACDCPKSVAKQDDHDDTDVDWSNPDEHEELANDIERHEGVHPLEGSYLDACTICDDRGWFLASSSWFDGPIYERCSCAAGDPETTYPGPLLVNPPTITYTDADALTV